MSESVLLYSQNEIKNRIFNIHDMQVMLDKDLAEIFNIETKRLNEQVRRNINRFPISFRFQLTKSEKDKLVANCDRLENLKHSSVLPFVFTEQGVAMLSAVLNSETAIKTSIQIIETFVEMRRFIQTNADIFNRLDNIELKIIENKQNNESKFEQIFKALENNKYEPEKGIFFEGQIFDAYVFISKIIKSALKNIILIDNYIDESTLLLLNKSDVNVKIYTKSISKQIELDILKYNKQYSKIEVIEFKTSHDRFLIIDNNELYHMGASLKDLGQKWFAFSKMNFLIPDILTKLENY